jgi:hypothetical protein
MQRLSRRIFRKRRSAFLKDRQFIERRQRFHFNAERRRSRSRERPIFSKFS